MKSLTRKFFIDVFSFPGFGLGGVFGSGGVLSIRFKTSSPFSCSLFLSVSDMPKSKSDDFIPIPGDKMLEAIGLVAVKWSALEFQIDNLLYWSSSPDDEAKAHVLNTCSTQQRWERLKKVLRQEHSDHCGTAGLIGLIDKALAIKGERDKIIHGLYSEPMSPTTKAESVIITLKSRKIKNEWPINRPRVFEAARKIDALFAEIIGHLLAHGEKLGNSILPNAWRHKDRI